MIVHKWHLEFEVWWFKQVTLLGITYDNYVYQLGTYF